MPVQALKYYLTLCVVALVKWFYTKHHRLMVNLWMVSIMTKNVAGILVRRVSTEYFGDDAVDRILTRLTKAMFRCGGEEIGQRQHVRPPGRLTALRWPEVRLNPCDGRKGR